MVGGRHWRWSLSRQQWVSPQAEVEGRRPLASSVGTDHVRLLLVQVGARRRGRVGGDVRGAQRRSHGVRRVGRRRPRALGRRRPRAASSRQATVQVGLRAVLQGGRRGSVGPREQGGALHRGAPGLPRDQSRGARLRGRQAANRRGLRFLLFARELVPFAADAERTRGAGRRRATRSRRSSRASPPAAPRASTRRRSRGSCSTSARTRPPRGAARG